MDRIVALKLIRPELLTDPEVVGRFYREVQVLSRLSHPNVVHAYDAGPLGSTHFLVMEYVEGIDLSRLVKQQGPLPIEEACDYLRQAARGLQHAHEKELVHRDVKPSNLLPRRTTARSRCWTSAWLACTSSAEGEIDAAADAGRRRGRHDGHAGLPGTGAGPRLPRRGHPRRHLQPRLHAVLPADGPAAVRRRLDGTEADAPQQTDPPPLAQFRSDVPPVLEAVVRRMLAKQPEDRYQTPHEVAGALNVFCSTEAPAAVLVEAAPAPSRRRGRFRWIAGAAAALLVLSMGSVWLLGSRSREPQVAERGTHRPRCPRQRN